MSFLNKFKFNADKISEEKTNIETVVSLFFYFIIALSYYVKKTFKNNFFIVLTLLSFVIYKYMFSRAKKSESIDGIEVPQLEDNYDLNLD